MRKGGREAALFRSVPHSSFPVRISAVIPDEPRSGADPGSMPEPFR